MLVAILIDYVEDRLVPAVIRFRDLDHKAEISAGVDGALPGVGDTLGRVFSFGLRTDVGNVYRTEERCGGDGRQDSHEQQKPSDEIGFASRKATHDSENPFIGI